ncbi:MAG: DUF5666 domain-containing protein [Acidimicrobiales bacterium]
MPALALGVTLASPAVAMAATTHAASTHVTATSASLVPAVEDIRGVVSSVNRSAGTFVIQSDETNAALPATITITTTPTTVFDAGARISVLTNQLVAGDRVSVSVVLLVPGSGALAGTLGGVAGGPGIVGGAGGTLGAASSPIGDLGTSLGNSVVRAIAVFII